MIADRAFDPLPQSAREQIRSAGSKLAVRFSDLGAREDAMLVGKLFGKQGLTTVPVDPRFATEFFEQARAVRERLDPKLVAPSLLSRVLAILADFRATRQANN